MNRIVCACDDDIADPHEIYDVFTRRCYMNDNLIFTPREPTMDLNRCKLVKAATKERMSRLIYMERLNKTRDRKRLAQEAANAMRLPPPRAQLVPKLFYPNMYNANVHLFRSFINMMNAAECRARYLSVYNSQTIFEDNTWIRLLDEARRSNEDYMKYVRHCEINKRVHGFIMERNYRRQQMRHAAEQERAAQLEMEHKLEYQRAVRLDREHRAELERAAVLEAELERASRFQRQRELERAPEFEREHMIELQTLELEPDFEDEQDK